MDLTTCKLYGVQRKRDLSNILKINCKEINKIVNSYKPYIANKSKKRLIEPVSSVELKKVQKRIQNLLKEIKYDSNVFSGISGRSYIDNGRLHLGCEYVVLNEHDHMNALRMQVLLQSLQKLPLYRSDIY